MVKRTALLLEWGFSPNDVLKKDKKDSSFFD
jgi:hypothetical protein